MAADIAVIAAYTEVMAADTGVTAGTAARTAVMDAVLVMVDITGKRYLLLD